MKVGTMDGGIDPEREGEIGAVELEGGGAPEGDEGRRGSGGSKGGESSRNFSRGEGGKELARDRGGCKEGGL